MVLSTFSCRHTKIRIISRATTDEKDQNLAGKIYRDKKETTTRWDGVLVL